MEEGFQQTSGSLMDLGRRVLIGGTPPPPNKSQSWSLWLSLHSWLKTICTTRNLEFIDNFNLFRKRPAFFRPDGIHPNGLGSRTLADNIFYAISTSCAH